jgi:aminoglycoside phosphotransferase (APT) family kinase protein
LSVGDDTPARRTYGWRARLVAFPQTDAIFTWGFDRLKQVANDSVPCCLIHGDLINRNVLVSDSRITGIFDWGCASYGDHLYELAWFEFWAPWFPSLNIDLLRSELESSAITSVRWCQGEIFAKPAGGHAGEVRRGIVPVG